MTRPLIQIDDEVRPMNDEEFFNYQKLIEENQAVEEAKKAKAAAKLELLSKLGITEDEAALLIS